MFKENRVETLSVFVLLFGHMYPCADFHITLQLGYLDVTVQEKLRSGWPGPFVKVEGCCD
jgi:hypothetical protein